MTKATDEKLKEQEGIVMNELERAAQQLEGGNIWLALATILRTGVKFWRWHRENEAA